MKLSPTIIVVQYISPLESDHPKLLIYLPIIYFKKLFEFYCLNNVIKKILKSLFGTFYCCMVVIIKLVVIINIYNTFNSPIH